MSALSARIATTNRPIKGISRLYASIQDFCFVSRGSYIQKLPRHLPGQHKIYHRDPKKGVYVVGIPSAFVTVYHAAVDSVNAAMGR